MSLSLDVFVGLVVIIFNNIYAGATILQFYVIIRRPTRNDLEVFRDNLPKVLQLVYFSVNNADIYARYTGRTSIDYLLYEKKNYSVILFQLGIHVTVVEPGYFRTEFLEGNSLSISPTIIEDYAETSGMIFFFLC